MTVYCAFHKITPLYVGVTKMSLPQRKGQHLRMARQGGNAAFGEAIRMYGEANIDWLVIDMCNKGDWEERERWWIKKLRPVCNVQPGGRSGVIPWNKNKQMCEEIKQRIREAAKSRKRTKRGAYSKKHRLAISEGGKRVRRKAFICHQNGKTYFNKVDAAKDLGISAVGISAVLMENYPHNSHHGYTFAYTDSLAQDKSPLIDLEARQGDRAQAGRKTLQRERLSEGTPNKRAMRQSEQRG